MPEDYNELQQQEEKKSGLLDEYYIPPKVIVPEWLNKVHLYICAAGALVVTVMCLLLRTSLYRMSVWVSLAIIGFYVVGQMVRIYLYNSFIKTLEIEQTDDMYLTVEPDGDAEPEQAPVSDVYAEAFDDDDE